jgi:hypothetical protein
MSGGFEEIESLFSRLLTELQSVLSEAEQREVRHFLDVGEYGLALETLVGIFAEEKKECAKTVSLQVAEVASRISIDPAPLLSRLQIK